MVTREFTPRPYQRLITAFILNNPRCAIWAGMGMGKSCATLNALDGMMLAGEPGPYLVLAPKRVAVSTWPDEVKKWKHLRHLSVVPIVGSEQERRMALNVKADIYTTNYEQLPWLVTHFGDKWPFRVVVSDESTKLKGFRLRQGTQRAKALASVSHTKIKRFIELTGTPSPNGLQDLWGQAWFIDKGERLGRTYDSFKQRWFQRSYDGFSVVPLGHAQTEIQDKMRDMCLTVDAKDWFDLKDPIVNNIYVDLPFKARKLYNDMEKEMFMALESGQEVEAFTAAARTIKCLQLANGSAYLEGENKKWENIHDVKLEALDEILEEAAGMPILVAYHFKSDLARLQKAFPQGRALDQNPDTIKDWNAGKIPMLFAHPASAGHGLNLQDGGNILVFFGHWWNLEERLQIIERIGPTRQMQAGHDRAMFIYNLIAKDTVDELVIERVETKRETQDILLAAMKRKGYGDLQLKVS